MEAVDLLVPRPREARATGSTLRLSGRPAVELPGGALPGRLRGLLGEALELCGLTAEAAPKRAAPAIVFRRAPGVPAQGYRLSVGPRGIAAEATDSAGLFYAAATLAQWMRLHAGEGEGAKLALPGLEVADAPDLTHRGVLLDVSRNKVPRLETLFELVERLASWKINQLQLYTEHTFAYAGHERVWRDASPLTAAEVRRLDRFCAERCVELVPNQNSFGHFHRWLVHEPYRALAECPEGLHHAFSTAAEPFSLCPVDPGSLALLEDLYEQLLPNFASSRLNVGLDETFDLGRGRSAAACAERGRGRVYLEFLQAVHRLARQHGRRIQFWADVVLEHPELVPELPDDAIPLVWGYEARHPFAEQCAPFAGRGGEFYVCPGTSSWISFAGRWQNALLNLAAAATAAGETGAAGLLITDWGDLGHLQPLPVSYLGLLAGAEMAWSRTAAERPLERDWAGLLDLHAFRRAGVGHLLRELGSVYLSTGAVIKNGTVLGRLVLSPDDDLTHERYASLTAIGLATAGERVGRVREALGRLPADPPGDDRVDRELAWTAGLLAFACGLGLARLRAGAAATLPALPAEDRRALRAALDPLVDELPGLWLARHRPGGLTDSHRRLRALGEALGRPG